MLPSLGLPELAVILVLAFTIFGAGKLPGVGKAIGETVKEFKKSTKGLVDDDDASQPALSAAGDEKTNAQPAEKN